MKFLDLKKLDGNLTVKGRLAGLPSAQFINRMLDKTNELVSKANTVDDSLTGKLDVPAGTTPGTSETPHFVFAEEVASNDGQGVWISGFFWGTLISTELPLTVFQESGDDFLIPITTTVFTQLKDEELDANSFANWATAMLITYSAGGSPAYGSYWNPSTSEWEQLTEKMRFLTDNEDGSWSLWEVDGSGVPTAAIIDAAVSPSGANFYRPLLISTGTTPTGTSGTPVSGTANYAEGEVTAPMTMIEIGGGDTRQTGFLPMKISENVTAGAPNTQYVELEIDSEGEVTPKPIDGFPADVIEVDASGFSGNLSGTDTDVQTALETIDALTLGGGGSTAIEVHENSAISTANNQADLSVIFNHAGIISGVPGTGPTPASAVVHIPMSRLGISIGVPAGVLNSEVNIKLGTAPTDGSYFDGDLDAAQLDPLIAFEFNADPGGPGLKVVYLTLEINSALPFEVLQYTVLSVNGDDYHDVFGIP